jgi:hypothetical protein
VVVATKMNQTNLHPADELADVRAQIRVLEERETLLREELLSGRCGLEGDDHVARLVRRRGGWVSLKTARRALGAILDPFIIKRTVTMVMVAAKAGDVGE